MRIKKYVVHSMAEALQEIRQDLGENAVILETRRVRKKGIWGFFSRKRAIEVIAAQDRQVSSRINPFSTHEGKEMGQLPSSPPLSRPSPSLGDAEHIAKELGEMKQYLLQLTSQNDVHLPADLTPIDQLLQRQEISSTVRTEIMERLINRYEEKGDLDVEEMARQVLEEYLGELPFKADQLPRFVCFVGPTGVGKTTTVAKLAADLMLNQKKKVGLITSDTYRIAAVEQLKTYAQILDAPLEVVYSPSELKEVIGRLDHCEHILMDTAGRNYLEAYYIGELKQLLPVGEQVEIFLLISLTSKYHDVQEMLTNFKSIPVHRFILTKMDETSSRGLAVNLLHEYRLPLAYVTTGQDVPDDIVRPNPGWLADVLLGKEKQNERSG